MPDSSLSLIVSGLEETLLSEGRKENDLRHYPFMDHTCLPQMADNTREPRHFHLRWDNQYSKYSHTINWLFYFQHIPTLLMPFFFFILDQNVNFCTFLSQRIAQLPRESCNYFEQPDSHLPPRLETQTYYKNGDYSKFIYCCMNPASPSH